MSREGRAAEAPFVKDDGASKEFKPFQQHLDELLAERGALGRFQARDGAMLPKVDIASPGVERFGRNAIISDADGVKQVIHQGKVFNVNPDGSIQGSKPGVLMYYDKANGKVVFDDGKVHAEFDPKKDTSTYDFKNPKSKEKIHLDVTSQGITESKDGKVTRFIPPDRSYSIDIDPAKGTATVNGRDGKPMKPDDPHKELLALKDKKVGTDVSGGLRGFSYDEGGGKERTIFPGSHSVLKNKGEIEEVSFGERTWKFSDEGGGNVKIKADDGAEYKVKKGDITFGSNMGQFDVKLGGDKKLKVDPANGSETTIDGKKSTTQYVEGPGRRPYTVEREKDAAGKWGITEVKDERGRWAFTYEPAASRDVANLKQVGPYTKGANCAGFSVSENGDVTVQLTPGKDQPYKSITYKSGSNQQIYEGKDGHKFDVTYEKVGAGADAEFKPTLVRDGHHTYKATYDDKGNISRLVDSLPGRSPADIVHAVGGDAKSIAFDSATKGFKVTLNKGEILELDPTSHSRRFTESKDGKTFTTETFGEKAKRTEHSVVTETVGDKKFIRSFTDTRGHSYGVVYKNDKDPADGIQTILGADNKPLPLLGQFTARFGAPKVAVDNEGRLTLSNPAGDTTFVKHPEGKTVFTSPKYGEVRNNEGMVVETTFPRVGGKPEGGLLIDRAAGRGLTRPLQSLTLKETGETLTRNPRTGQYEYKDPKDPDKPQSFNASVISDANGNVFINGRALGKDPSGKDVLAALSAPPADVGPRRPEDPRLPDGGLRPPDGWFADPRAAADFNRGRFVKVAGLPNGGAVYKDGTRVERTPNPGGGGGTIVTTTDGSTGVQIKTLLDQRGRAVSIQNPDGTVWTRTPNNQNGYSLWVSNTGDQSWAKTEGRGLGIDQFGNLHFKKLITDGFGRQVQGSFVCLPNYTNLYDGGQFNHFRKTGVIMPMAPPWMMPPQPNFARRFPPMPPRAPRLLI